MLLVEVLIADVTSTRSRLLFSYIPALPFIVSLSMIQLATSADLSAIRSTLGSVEI